MVAAAIIQVNKPGSVATANTVTTANKPGSVATANKVTTIKVSIAAAKINC